MVVLDKVTVSFMKWLYVTAWWVYHGIHVLTDMIWLSGFSWHCKSSGVLKSSKVYYSDNQQDLLPSTQVEALETFYYHYTFYSKSNTYYLLIGFESSHLLGWLVVLRIYVALAIFQPYRHIEEEDNQSLKL